MATSVEDGHPVTLSDRRPIGKMDDKDAEETDEGFVLPPEGSRNAKWWYATYHNVTAIVGAGVLGLPTAMVYLGWEGGAVVLVMSWFITLFTLWQMVELHETKDGERVDTYYQLGQKAFGPNLGLWLVLPQQVIHQVGTNIVYMVTGGHALWQFYVLIHCQHIELVAVGAGNQCCGKLGRAAFVVFFALFPLVLAQLADFNSIASVSLLSSVMSICYCMIAWIDSLHLGKSNHSDFADPVKPLAVCPTSYQFSGADALARTDYLPRITESDQVFGALSALGIVLFAHSGHNVVLEIQATLPSTLKCPSKIAMWRGVMVAYIIVAFCYFPVAFAGYWAFGTTLPTRGASTGNPRSGNILLQLGEPTALIATANLFVAIHLSGGYLVYAMPMFDLMEKVLVKRFGFKPTPPGGTSMMRIVTRSTYVLSTASVALAFPFFKDLLGFVGGFAMTPTTYFMPCILWLKLKKPKVFSVSWLINWALIVTGVLMGILASIGGLRNIIVDASIEEHLDYLDCTDTIQYPRHCSLKSLNATGRYKFFDEFSCKSTTNFTSVICKVHFQ